MLRITIQLAVHSLNYIQLPPRWPHTLVTDSCMMISENTVQSVH